jgi:hypothetical protein
MEQSPSREADSHFARQDLPPFYGIRRFITLHWSLPILSYINPTHTVMSYYFKIHFGIVLFQVLSSCVTFRNNKI